MANAATKSRKWINKNSGPVTIGAVCLLAFLLYIIVTQLMPGSPQMEVPDAWFYDLKTGQLFAAPSDRVPPIPTDSGPLDNGMPAGVRAHVFTCGSCTRDEMFVAYVSTYTQEAKALLEKVNAAQKDGGAEVSPDKMMEWQWKVEQGNAIKAVDIEVDQPLADGWFAMESDEAYQISQKVNERCGPGKRAKPCSPELD
ncbi:MAG: hypothetical protein R3336_08600 [Phycisphaeraceae bacterium]|nr:hypothetical protein [Phycisphaeraceae bacterium]